MLRSLPWCAATVVLVFAGLAAAQSPPAGRDQRLVRPKILMLQDGPKYSDQLLRGHHVQVLGSREFKGKTWVEISANIAEGGLNRAVTGWVSPDNLVALQPLTDPATGRGKMVADIAGLLNHYFSPGMTYADTLTPAVVRNSTNDTARSKELIGAMQYNLKRLKAASLAELDEEAKEFVADAIAKYERVTRAVQALDGLIRISDQDYALAWAADVGLGIFENVILPAIEVAFPASIPAIEAGKKTLQVSGLRDSLKQQKVYYKSLRDFREKTLAGVLGVLDETRSLGATLWQVRSRRLSAPAEGAIMVDLRRYCVAETFGHHGVVAVNGYDRTLTNCLIKITIQGEKNEEGYAYRYVDRWDAGQSVSLKCDPKGVEADKRLFGKTSVAEPIRVRCEVVADQLPRPVTSESTYNADASRADLAVFMRDHFKLQLKDTNYFRKVLNGTGPSLQCTIHMAWPEAVEELSGLRDVEVTYVVKSGDQVLNTLTDVIATTQLTKQPNNMPFFVTRNELGDPRPDSVQLFLRPKGVTCMPLAVQFAVKTN